MFMVNEFSLFSGYSTFSLDLFSLLAILFGAFVIISKNPIISVLFLIGLFLSISCYLILIGFNFIGLSYLLVYIGAVSILFLFILMLINIRISDLLIDSFNSIPLAIVLGGLFISFVSLVLPFMLVVFTPEPYSKLTSLKKLFSVSSSSWDGYLAETSHITSIGNILYGNYSIWLILTSIILLLAMVGCIVITLKEGKTYEKVSYINPHSYKNLPYGINKFRSLAKYGKRTMATSGNPNSSKINILLEEFSKINNKRPLEKCKQNQIDLVNMIRKYPGMPDQVTYETVVITLTKLSKKELEKSITPDPDNNSLLEIMDFSIFAKNPASLFNNLAGNMNRADFIKPATYNDFLLETIEWANFVLKNTNLMCEITHDYIKKGHIVGDELLSFFTFMHTMKQDAEKLKKVTEENFTVLKPLADQIDEIQNVRRP